MTRAESEKVISLVMTIMVCYERTLEPINKYFRSHDNEDLADRIESGFFELNTLVNEKLTEMTGVPL